MAAETTSVARRWHAAITGAAVVFGCFAVILAAPLPQELREQASALGLLLGGLAVMTRCLQVAARCSGRQRRPWVLLGAAVGVALLGNAWNLVVGADPVRAPDPLGESAIVAGTALSIAGLLAFATARQRGAELAVMLLDGLVMGCAALVIASVLLWSEILAADPLPERPMPLLLPILDVAMATVALLLIIRARGSRLFFALIGGGFLLYAAADLVFAAGAADGSYAFGTVRDLGWIGGYLLFAVATWHPEAADPSGNGEATRGSGAGGTVVVFGVLFLALATQFLAFDESTISPTLAVLWLVLVLAVGGRQGLLAADNAALRWGLEQRVREQTADLRRLAHNNQLLLSSVGDGIYGVDTQGRITFLNPSAAAILGHDSDTLLGAPAHQTFHAPRPDGTEYPEEQCYVTEAIRDGIVSSGEEDVYLRADGAPLPVEITASPLLEGDRISGAVVVFRDVTQRHEVDRMKNELLSVVSHELRTPLTSIRGALGLLGDGGLVTLTPQGERLVSIATRSAERLHRLINDILDIERLRSGKLTMRLAPHDAQELLQLAASEIAGLAAASGVEVHVGRASGRVLVDRDRIAQTLTNLLGNAVKFSPPGGTVWLEAEAAGDVVTFSVRDQGRGIAPDKLEAVFEPFEQADSSDAREKGGTGLGLAISRGIVDRHGGRIWAESGVGDGATVRFELPWLREARCHGTDQLLVCGDEPAAVAGFAASLSRAGYPVSGVTDAAEAVRLALESPPALVLVDLAVGGVTGGQVLERLRSQEATRRTRVLVMSLRPAASEPRLARLADGWLTKPVTESRLHEAVCGLTAHGAPAGRA